MRKRTVFDTMAENSSKLSLPSLASRQSQCWNLQDRDRDRDRYIPVLISLHDRLIDNLLQLRILFTHESIPIPNVRGFVP